MKAFLVCIFILGIQLVPMKTLAFFGNPADTMYLAQLLANSLKQLYELQRMLETGRDTLGLLRDVNRGINDSLRVIDSLGPYIDPGLYKELRQVAQIAKHLESIYGIVVPSKDAQAFKETDQVASEAISMNNSIYDYTKEIDKLAEEIKEFSHSVSPGGAQKLTAQTLGVMIHVQNLQLRATGAALKLSAQSLLIRNKEKKDDSAEYLKESNLLKSKMKAENIPFEFPRF